MSFGATVTLKDGTVVPQIGLGTWLSKPHEVENAVEYAVRHGYRHLDLAFIYENQDEVGKALSRVLVEKGGPNPVVKRDELFITSKLWCNAFQPDEVEKQLDEGLAQCGLEYFDLYLIHWPVAFKAGKNLYPPDQKNPGWVEIDRTVSLEQTYRKLLELKNKKGPNGKPKVLNVGVSNFSKVVLEKLLAKLDKSEYPAVNQIEAHPYLPQDELLEYCTSNGIHVTAYSPLGNNLKNKPKLTDHDTVKEIAKKLGATEAQVLIAWGAQRGYTVIPKSVQAERIESNFKQITLSEEDVQALNALSKPSHTRFNIPYLYKPRWNINIFNEEEEKTATNNPIVTTEDLEAVKASL